MSREDNIATQEKLGEGVNAGNPAIAHEAFAPDAVDHDPAPDQGPGAAGFEQFLTALTTAFPDAHIEVEHMVADDDNVCIAYTLSGTHQGDFQGIAPTGKSISVRGVQIGRFEDAKIVERWGSTDEVGILTQLGLDPMS